MPRTLSEEEIQQQGLQRGVDFPEDVEISINENLTRHQFQDTTIIARSSDSDSNQNIELLKRLGFDRFEYNSNSFRLRIIGQFRVSKDKCLDLYHENFKVFMLQQLDDIEYDLHDFINQLKLKIENENNRR